MNSTKDISPSTPRQENHVLLKTPYGELRLGEDGVHEHAAMKARELNALLTLISADGRERFTSLNDDLQDSLLWIASQAAHEIDQLIGQIVITAKQVTQ